MSAGILYTISAPSGAGKTSLVRALLEREDGLALSVSHTTRPRRDGERDGVDYYFVDDATFQEMVDAGAFLEHARVFDNRYGTSRRVVEETLAGGFDLVLEIDWQGAHQVRESVEGAISIFILPPSRAALVERLQGRGLDSDEVIERRMAAAIDEMSHYDECDYLVVNDDFEDALADLRGIVRAGRVQRPRQAARHRALIEALLAPPDAVQ
ncbi:MAG: guanylate kinase [Halofilum sp. (in: g-proteobacteria)]|nr:guanylate kinase [Halofilum sp. (in: g-proteobacteria)]